MNAVDKSNAPTGASGNFRTEPPLLGGMKRTFWFFVVVVLAVGLALSAMSAMFIYGEIAQLVQDWYVFNRAAWFGSAFAVSLTFLLPVFLIHAIAFAWRRMLRGS